MTREEKIRQAALKYSFDTDGGAAGDLNTAHDDFMEGAMWADKHAVNPWHSFKDGDIPEEPKGDRSYLPFVVVTEGDYKLLAYCDYDALENIEFFDDCELMLNTVYWMEIPQLPKESEVEK